MEGKCTGHLTNLSVGKCTCVNIWWGPGVGVEQRWVESLSCPRSSRPFPLWELVFLGWRSGQSACPLNRREAASSMGLFASARSGGVEFDSPGKSQPIKRCFLAANERTCWEGHTHWYHVGRNYVDQWRLEVNFFAEWGGGVEVSNSTVRCRMLKCVISQSKACIYVSLWRVPSPLEILRCKL